MDEKKFKKHLADLAHGHHHPEEHDWDEGTIEISNKPAKVAVKARAAKARTAKTRTAKSRRRKK